MTEYLRSWVMAADRHAIARLPLRAAYAGALEVSTRLLAGHSYIEAAYLRRGLLKSDWVPGGSDIDVTMVVRTLPPEEEYARLSRFGRHYRALKVALPMLGETYALTRDELTEHLACHPVEHVESRGWRPLFGGPLAPTTPRDLWPAALTEALAAYAEMWKIHRLPRPLDRLRTRAFAKHYVDLLNLVPRYTPCASRIEYLREHDEEWYRIAERGYVDGNEAALSRVLREAFALLDAAAPRGRALPSGGTAHDAARDLRLRARLGANFVGSVARDLTFVVMTALDGFPDEGIPVTPRLFAHAKESRLFHSWREGPATLAAVRARLSSAPIVLRERVMRGDTSPHYVRDYLPRLLAARALGTPTPPPEAVRRFVVRERDARGQFLRGMRGLRRARDMQ